MQVNMSSKKKLTVTFRNPYFPEPVSASRQRDMSEPTGIVEGDVVWNLVHESPLDRRGTRPGGEISSKPQRMCSLAFASAAWENAVVASQHVVRDGKFEIESPQGETFTYEASTLVELQAKVRENFLWQPDGIVLSTSEDTADFTSDHSSKCNLVNVCVQGPAVTKAWSGSAALQTKAGDTLYLVAVVGYTQKYNKDATYFKVDPQRTFIRPMTSRGINNENMTKINDMTKKPLSETNLSVIARTWKIGKVLDSAASKIGGVMAKKRGRAPVAVKCAVSLTSVDHMIAGFSENEEDNDEEEQEEWY